MAGNRGKNTSVQERYFFSRSFRDSTRLHLQHYIWKERHGYLLHPSIPRPADKSWKVADVGTGNACWILDAAAHELPSQWSLHGFDVSGEQFPPPSALPANVTLHVQDAFAAELPATLVGSFDIVHIRAFAAVIKGGDPRPLLANLVRMLQPGGYLQWDEFDPASFAAYAPPLPAQVESVGNGGDSLVSLNPVSKQKTDQMVKAFKGFLTQMQIEVSWIPKLPSIMAESSLDVKAAKTWDAGSCTPLLRKMYTDNWMMALEEVCEIMISRGDVAGMTVEQFRELLGEVIEETKNGVSLWIDFLATVGQKTTNAT